jgi:hypothetical protein
MPQQTTTQHNNKITFDKNVKKKFLKNDSFLITSHQPSLLPFRGKTKITCLFSRGLTIFSLEKTEDIMVALRPLL